MREALPCLVLCVVGLALAGCDESANQSCPEQEGIYLATYQKLGGTCADSFPGNALELAKTKDDRITKVENRLNDSLTTEVTFKGCTLGIKQATEADGQLTTHLAGDLNIEDEVSMSGTMQRYEYLQDGGVACEGLYEARYTRRDVVIGGAVEHGGTAR